VITAVILAGGASTRMGTPKALLSDPEGRPFVARLVRTFVAAQIPEIIVVTGEMHDQIITALDRDRVESGLPQSMQGLLTSCLRVVRNEAPERGQLSSLWTGLDAALNPELEALLVTLVDVPMVKESTVRAVVDTWRQSRPPIVRPAIGDRHGHPVLFDRATFEELRRASLDEGAKAVVRAHAYELVNVPVDDEGCLVDVDTPDDYRKLVGFGNRAED
jgi:molybdenum cofactor cytidylyltransferase